MKINLHMKNLLLDILLIKIIIFPQKVFSNNSYQFAYRSDIEIKCAQKHLEQPNQPAKKNCTTQEHDEKKVYPFSYTQEEH